MVNRNYNIVVDYISKEFDLDKGKLNTYTSLSEIGLDGDDVLDFLLGFFKRFGIEYEQTNYKDFIPLESYPIFFGILSLFKRNEIVDNEIFIKDLVISLDKKKWYK
ncbi:DUF1493 family protein [Chishuiella sp.]|uniref:DUF1493 family protein n=1 Tax=Chishuiella sp. TaxID=1969467 RepID=UPI0028AB40EA|nr:DUF1493 family protein [Chishuiella sp.]